MSQFRPQALRFQDAEFQHRFAWCRSRWEGRSLRWVPWGMPRLNQDFQHSVFFLCAQNQDGSLSKPRGSGVIVGHFPRKGGVPRHFYAVTCWHVAVRSGASIIRINTKTGSRLIEFDPVEWQFIPGGDDIAAVDITDRLQQGDAISCVPHNLLASKDFIKDDEVGIGEDGFMLGLFADQPGQNRNMVAARFGNVSLLATDDAPLEQPNDNSRPSHIFDLRSRPGFSGSPVFIYRTPAGDLRTASKRGGDKRNRPRLDHLSQNDQYQRQSFYDWIEERETKANTFLALFGIHVGQYHDRISVRKAKKARAEHLPIIEGDELDVPNSMALVAPAWEITTLLDLDIFKRQREEREMSDQKKREQQNTAKPEAISDDVDDLATDENPTHREDFTSLLNEAARKRPQGDQT